MARKRTTFIVKVGDKEKRMTNLPKAKEQLRKWEKQMGEIGIIYAETPWGLSVVIDGEEWKWDPVHYAHQIPYWAR
jgi:hypothetical protein